MSMIPIKYLQTGVVKYRNEKKRIKMGQEANVSAELGGFLIGAGYAVAIKKSEDKTEYVEKPPEESTDKPTPEEPTVTSDVAPDIVSQSVASSRKRKKDGKDDGTL